MPEQTALNHIIDIPPYPIYTIRVLEGTALYNNGSGYNMMVCLGYLASIKKNAAERVAAREDYRNFLRQHGVYTTNVEYHPDEIRPRFPAAQLT